jgi:hypothetical protein
MEIPLPNPFSRIGIQIAANTRNSEIEMVRIRRAIETGNENESVDFKRDCYSKGKSTDFLNDVCSFANSNGGLIIIGVDQKDDPPHDPVGVDAHDLEPCLARLSEWTRKYLLPNQSVVNIYKYMYGNGKPLIVVSVRKSMFGPVYFERNGGHVFKVRGGDGTRDARIDELRRLIKASPASRLQIEASLIADDFRRHSILHGKIFVEGYGPEVERVWSEYPKMNPDWPGYISYSQSSGMITDVEIVDVRDIDKELLPDDVVPMVGKEEIGPMGRVPAKGIGYAIYEHIDGSGIDDFKQLCDHASSLLRKTELELLYQVPSLYGITYWTLQDWIHILIYASVQQGLGRSMVLGPGGGRPTFESMEKDASSRSAYARQKFTIPGDACLFSARLLEEIAAFV